MWTKIKQFLTPPVFEDEEKTRVAWMLNIILQATFMALLLGLLAGSAFFALINIAVLALFLIMILAIWFTMRRGYVKPAVTSYVVLSLLLITVDIYFVGTVRAPVAGGYIVLVIIAGLLIGNRAMVIATLFSLLVLFGLTLAESNGFITPLYSSVGIGQWVTHAILLSIAAVLLGMTTQSINTALQKARAQAQTLAEQAQEIAVFRALAENATDTILMGTPQGIITYANPAAYAAFGWNPETQELVGKGIPALLPEAEDEAVRQENLSAIFRAESWRGEIKHRRKDNTVFDTADTIFPIWNDHDEQVALAAIIRDITEERKAQLEREHLQAQREQLQQETLEAQKQVIQDLSTPVIPVLDQIIVLPLVGTIDSMRARDITRSLLAGISQHKARIVILDVTGVPLVDTGVANHLNKTIQAAQLKGAKTIVTGISDAVAEAIVDLGIDWGQMTTLSDLQTGLVVALRSLGVELRKA
jgi:PAS domain S-box-containing protein